MIDNLSIFGSRFGKKRREKKFLTVNTHWPMDTYCISKVGTLMRVQKMMTMQKQLLSKYSTKFLHSLEKKESFCVFGHSLDQQSHFLDTYRCFKCFTAISFHCVCVFLRKGCTVIRVIQFISVLLTI